MRLRNKVINVFIVITFITIVTRIAVAAPQHELLKIRCSQTPERVRVVLDMSSIPDYSAAMISDLAYLQIDLPHTVVKGMVPELRFNDSHVAAVRLLETEPGRQRLYIDLKMAAAYNIFTLKNPARLVIDINRIFEQKIKEEIAPGITHTYWLRGQAAGPVAAHILEVDLRRGYAVKPLLSNGAVQGLDTLSAMAARPDVVAAVNGAYFAPGGHIIGLLKMDGEIISTPTVPRTAVGILPDGRIFLDQAEYSGAAFLPGGRTVAINAVNSERGDNELVLYNGYYGASTLTNKFGVEYVVAGGKVTAAGDGNTPIPAGAVVLSAHGEAAKALSGLKIGDTVTITQTLGQIWDKAVHALGAGPALVKNGGVYITTKIEEFGSDVAGGRAPRTALGLMPDGKLLLVTVDGRQQHSVGLTLWELALFMQELGAVEAMNLDGGGSTEMVICDKVVNKPSDGRERRIGSGLAVVSTKLAN
ncbi:MAG: phosphodiester glycosidase family protein [Negativicutes bacterium]|nr:phosphodiester glycosidase family protein [Negativicutes bacterium]